MAVTTGFQGRTFDVPQTGVPCIDLPSRSPCVAADAIFADAKAFLSSSEARQMSESALNLLPERYLVEMRRRVTIATASRAPPRTPWKPPRYSTSSTWQRRRGVRCLSPAHRRACRHLVRDPMGVDRPAVTLGCCCGGPQPPRAAGALMRTETSHEAREDQRKSPIGRGRQKYRRPPDPPPLLTTP